MATATKSKTAQQRSLTTKPRLKPGDHFITTAEAARLLGITVPGVIGRLKSGTITGYKQLGAGGRYSWHASRDSVLASPPVRKRAKPKAKAKAAQKPVRKPLTKVKLASPVDPVSYRGPGVVAARRSALPAPPTVPLPEPPSQANQAAIAMAAAFDAGARSLLPRLRLAALSALVLGLLGGQFAAVHGTQLF